MGILVPLRLGARGFWRASLSLVGIVDERNGPEAARTRSRWLCCKAMGRTVSPWILRLRRVLFHGWSAAVSGPSHTSAAVASTAKIGITLAANSESRTP